ncbi:hypothetical protein V6N13_122304 [Hibiscus sabdariffa]
MIGSQIVASKRFDSSEQKLLAEFSHVLLDWLFGLLEMQKPIPMVIEVLLVVVFLLEFLHKEIPCDLLSRSS